MKTRHLFQLGTLASALIGLAAHAEDTLPTVVVTATRTPVTADASLAALSLISREQIDTSSARDVGDLLRDYAGLTVVRSGGIGQQTSVFIRGANSNQTLVLVDGTPITNGTSGLSDLQNISLSSIDHIEVVKGPSSTLYGSNAIGGVVNIITRSIPTRPTTDIEATAAGEHTVAGHVRQSFTLGDLTGDVNYGELLTKGYPVFSDSNVKRGYSNTDAGGDLNYHKNDLTVRAHFQDNSGTGKYLDPFSYTGLSHDYNDSVGTLEARYQVAPTYLTTLRLSFFHNHLNENQQDPYQAGAYDFYYSTRRQIDWQNDYILPDNLVTIGATHQSEKRSEFSFGSGYDQPRKTMAGYIQDQAQFGSFSAQVAGRVEHDSQFGQHETGNLQLGEAIDKHNRIYASLGTAFRAPSGDDLYGFGGNPKLKPEQSLNHEIGYHYDSTGVQAQVDVYQNDVKQLINFDPVTYTAYNIDRSRLKGAEASLDLTQSTWSWQTHANYVAAIDRANQQQLPRRPRRTLGSSVDYHPASWFVGAEINTASHSTNSVYDSIVLPGYAVYGVHAGVNVNPMTTVRLNVDNLTNHHYGVAASGNLSNGDTRYYVAQPRLVSLTVNLRLQ